MLPFTADVLDALMAQYNAAILPAQVIAWFLGLSAVVLTVRPLPGGDRFIAALLAAAWAWVGIVWHGLTFASINFAAPAYGVLFVLQALLLAWSGLFHRRLAFEFRADVFGWAGLAYMVYALIGQPLIEWSAGPGWASTPLFGVAPGPTTIATFGFLLLCARRPPLTLAVIPLLWSLMEGATGWVLGIPQDLVLAAAGLAGIGLLLWKWRAASAHRG